MPIITSTWYQTGLWNYNILFKFLHLRLNAVREICSRCPLVMNEDLLRDLAQYKNYKERSVMMAARSLIHLYRSSMPELLHKKDRVCMLITWFDWQVSCCFTICFLYWDIFLTVISEIFSATDYLLSTWLTHKIYLISMILKPAGNCVSFCLLLYRHICIFWLRYSFPCLVYCLSFVCYHF